MDRCRSRSWRRSGDRSRGGDWLSQVAGGRLEASCREGHRSHHRGLW